MDTKYVMMGWGANTFGQVAGTTTDEPIPVLINQPNDPLSPLMPPQRIIGGANHTLLVDAQSRLFVCGSNQYSQLGIVLDTPVQVPISIKSESTIPCTFKWIYVPFPIDASITDVAAGWAHSLVCLDSGHVFAFGDNSFGQCTLKQACKLPQLLPPPLNTCVSVACGLRHSLALTRSGTIYAWGASKSGQCGVLAGMSNGLIKITLPNSEIPKSIAAGAYHSLALSISGRVYGWGRNKHGQIGQVLDIKHDHQPKVINFPMDVSDIVNVHAGWSHSIFVTANGLVYMCGRNTFGQLGTTLLMDTCVQPTLVNLEYPVKHICAGSEHTTVISDSGRVLAWGWNEHGNCGIACTLLDRWQASIQRPPIESLNLDNVLVPTNVAWHLNLPHECEWRPILVGGGYAHTFLVLESK